MKLLKEINRSQAINFDGKRVYREAVRGVIIEGRTLLMVYSSKHGIYKFPGGGVEAGESYEESLTREIGEESGARLLSIDKEIGKVIEFDKAKDKGYDVFQMTSYYYKCKVDPNLGEQTLDQHEIELGLRPKWVDIDKAILANQRLLETGNPPNWTARETHVLKYIKNKLTL